MLYSHVLLSMFTRFLGIRGWWRGVHGLRFIFHCGGPVNFQMSSTNGLEVAKCQAGQFCSCRAERINSIRGAGCGFRLLISFRNRQMLFSVYSTTFQRTLPLVSISIACNASMLTSAELSGDSE
jgi:hypothetical protein